MTIEESIAYITEWLKDEYALNNKDREVLTMAISALEQEPTVQDKQAESEKYQKAFDDGYANGYAQARFDYEQELCDDAVSRKDIIALIQCSEYELQDRVDNDAMCNDVRELPSATQKPKTGHWIIIDDCEKFIAKCSECGRIEDSRMISKYPYCHCGAKMVEPQESEKINCKTTKCENCKNHNYCDYEPQKSEK